MGSKVGGVDWCLRVFLRPMVHRWSDNQFRIAMVYVGETWWSGDGF